jgi:hypothetical protein
MDAGAFLSLEGAELGAGRKCSPIDILCVGKQNVNQTELCSCVLQMSCLGMKPF